jgi:hypothetical protein
MKASLRKTGRDPQQIPENRSSRSDSLAPALGGGRGVGAAVQDFSSDNGEPAIQLTASKIPPQVPLAVDGGAWGDRGEPTPASVRTPKRRSGRRRSDSAAGATPAAKERFKSMRTGGAATGVTRAKRLARRSSRSDHASHWRPGFRARRVVGVAIWRTRSERSVSARERSGRQFVKRASGSRRRSRSEGLRASTRSSATGRAAFATVRKAMPHSPVKRTAVPSNPLLWSRMAPKRPRMALEIEDGKGDDRAEAETTQLVGEAGLYE